MCIVDTDHSHTHPRPHPSLSRWHPSSQHAPFLLLCRHAEEAHATAECQLIRIQLCICSQETDFEPSNCGCDSSNRDCYDASRPVISKYQFCYKEDFI